MASQCGAFCSFCGKCGRSVTGAFRAEVPEGIAPPGVIPARAAGADGPGLRADEERPAAPAASRA